MQVIERLLLTVAHAQLPLLHAGDELTGDGETAMDMGWGAMGRPGWEGHRCEQVVGCPGRGTHGVGCGGCPAVALCVDADFLFNNPIQPFNDAPDVAFLQSPTLQQPTNRYKCRQNIGEKY